MVQKQGSPNYEKQSTLEKNFMSRIYNIWTCQFRMNLDEKSINKITVQSTSVHSVYHHLTLGKYLSSPKIMFHFIKLSQNSVVFCSLSKTLSIRKEQIDVEEEERQKESVPSPTTPQQRIVSYCNKDKVNGKYLYFYHLMHYIFLKLTTQIDHLNTIWFCFVVHQSRMDGLNF